MLVFETRADYAVVRRQVSIREASEAAGAMLSGRTAVYASDDEAILSAFDQKMTLDLSSEPLEISVAREVLE